MRGLGQEARRRTLHIGGIAAAIGAGLGRYWVSCQFADVPRAAFLLTPAAAVIAPGVAGLLASRLQCPARVVQDAGLSVLVVASCAYFGLAAGMAYLPAVVLLCAASLGVSFALSWRAAGDLSNARLVALQLALHDAIVSECDIVPASAQPFYDPALAGQSETMLANTNEAARFINGNSALVSGLANPARSINKARGLHRKHCD